MAMHITARSSRSRRSKRAVMSDINVTPLVDVMLVLLVIFMLTAPLLTIGIPIDLPKTKAASLTENSEPITISLDKEGKLYLQETEITLVELVPKVQSIMAAKPETKIFVRGDQNITYGQIMHVMGILNTAGFSKVALIAELPESKTGKK
jgi:biopolymer transport protein TolR